MTLPATPSREDALRAEIADLRQRLDGQAADARVEHERLTYELGHRVKNTLGVVQALAGQTLRGAATPQEAADTLNHRILALSRANDAILRQSWTTAGLLTVARCVLQPAGDAQSPAVTIEGPDLPIAAGAALSFCMALHELLTNARRHGALGVPAGRVVLAWTVTGAPPEARLDLSWREFGGPPVEEPARRRFGLRLIEQSMKSAFGRDVTLAFEPDGIVCRARAQVAALTRPA